MRLRKVRDHHPWWRKLFFFALRKKYRPEVPGVLLTLLYRGDLFGQP